MVNAIRKIVILTLLIAGIGFLLFKGFLFQYRGERIPAGASVAGIDVSEATIDQAREQLIEAFERPVYIYHRENHAELAPKEVGFVLDLDSMLGELQDKTASVDRWLAFAAFVLTRPIYRIDVPLYATHDRQALQAYLKSVSEILDRPAQPAQLLSRDGPADQGHAGYVTDLEASLPMVEQALYSLDNRDVNLTIIDQEAPEPNLGLVAEIIENNLQTFDGIGSVFVKDLKTGEELAINADIALSGLSILKIAIFEEAYRALDDPPNPYQEQIFMDTATRSSNFGANLLLHVAAGVDNTYVGADILTESMHRLGLVNTFMAVPYDATPPLNRKSTYVTPANSRPDLLITPDSTMQTTAEEVGTLLSMIYDCSRGGGALLAVYPDELTPEECQAIIDLMALNEEGNLIRFGVPPGTTVSHKHGWALGTHGDAGIVFSPGGDYVIVEYLSQAEGWLVAEQSFPILREISRLVYNYFNMDQPFLMEDSEQRGQIDPLNPFAEGEQEGAEEGVEEEQGEASPPETGS